MRARDVFLPALLALFALAGCTRETAQQPKSQADMKAEIRAILKENPDIVMDVLRDQKVALLETVEQGAKARQEAERERQLQAGLQNPYKPQIDPSRPVLGNPDAPVTIVEYSDFQCPYCAKAAETLKQLLERNPGKFSLRFKHLPLHAESKQEALYFEAIGLQDPALAWRFHDAVFARRDEIARDKAKALDEIAASLGVNMAKLKADMARPDLSARIDADEAEARSFGFQGSPSFLFNGAPVVGALSLEEYEKIGTRVAQSKAAQPAKDDSGTCLDCPPKNSK